MNIKKNKLLFGVLLLVVIISVNFISAAPPIQKNVNIQLGLDIEFSKIEIIEVNKSFTFNFHVFNVSNGLRLDNTSVVCTFHLFDNTGEHIVNEQELEYITIDNDWEYAAEGGNFSEIGQYYVLTDCNDGGFGGFVSFGFDVTSTGHELDEPQAKVIVGLIILLIFLSTIFILVGMKIEYLPFKIFLIALGALFLLVLVGVSVTIIKQLLIVGVVFSATFVNLYRLMLILVSAGGIGLMIYIIVMSIKQFAYMRGLKDEDDDEDKD